CAAIPMFRVRSSGNFRSGEFGPFAAADFFSAVAVAIKLPAEMCKGAVRLRHLVSVFAFLDRVALTVGRVFNFGSKRFRHRRAFSGTASTGCATLRALRSIFGATPAPSINAETVERAAHNVIAHARQIFYSSPAHEHD